MSTTAESGSMGASTPPGTGDPGAPLFRLGPPPVFPLFDVHVNAMATADTSGLYRVQSFEEASEGTDAANLSPAAAPDYAGPNAAVLRWTSQAGGAFRAMLRLRGRRVPDPLRSRYRLRQAVRLRSAPAPDLSALSQYAAVKLMPHADGLPGPETIRAIGAAGRPILIHAGANCPIAFVEKYVLAHTDGPVILAHMGAWPCAMEELEAAVALAQRNPQVWLETSGVWIGNFLTYAAERVPEQVLFGSNAPMCDPAVQWDHVASAVRDDRVLEGIAYQNAERLFGETLA